MGGGCMEFRLHNFVNNFRTSFMDEYSHQNIRKKLKDNRVIRCKRKTF